MGSHVGCKGKSAWSSPCLWDFSPLIVYAPVSPFQVKLRNDMPDDMLKDAIETSRRIISEVEDFETQGELEFLSRTMLQADHSFTMSSHNRFGMRGGY